MKLPHGEIQAIQCTCGQMPNQFEGIVDGMSFYFRARHGYWALYINPNGTDGLDGEIVAEGGNGEPEQGCPSGWNDPDDVEKFIRAEMRRLAS